jgi:hypothetical protein
LSTKQKINGQRDNLAELWAGVIPADNLLLGRNLVEHAEHRLQVLRVKEERIGVVGVLIEWDFKKNFSSFISRTLFSK